MPIKWTRAPKNEQGRIPWEAGKVYTWGRGRPLRWLCVRTDEDNAYYLVRGTAASNSSELRASTHPLEGAFWVREPFAAEKAEMVRALVKEAAGVD